MGDHPLFPDISWGKKRIDMVTGLPRTFLEVPFWDRNQIETMQGKFFLKVKTVIGRDPKGQL